MAAFCRPARVRVPADDKLEVPAAAGETETVLRRLLVPRYDSLGRTLQEQGYRAGELADRVVRAIGRVNLQMDLFSVESGKKGTVIGPGFPARLVPPRAGEAAKANARDRVLLQVQVEDGHGELPAAVVVALHGQHVRGANASGHAEDNLVGQVAAGDQQFGGVVADRALDRDVVRDHEDRRHAPSVGRAPIEL